MKPIIPAQLIAILASVCILVTLVLTVSVEYSEVEYTHCLRKEWRVRSFLIYSRITCDFGGASGLFNKGY